MRTKKAPKVAPKKKAVPRKAPRRPKAPDPGPPARIALTPSVFATVSTVDWGFAHYHGDWSLVGKEPKCKGLTLGRFVADRMGLDRTLAVAFKDGNPLNCTRGNVFVTRYVWARGTVRQLTEDDRGEKEWHEHDGWLYGNVGLYADPHGWRLIHLPSGMYVGAAWSSLKRAKAGAEAIHAVKNLAELDNYAKLKAIELKRWREVITRHREFT